MVEVADVLCWYRRKSTRFSLVSLQLSTSPIVCLCVMDRTRAPHADCGRQDVRHLVFGFWDDLAEVRDGLAQYRQLAAIVQHDRLGNPNGNPDRPTTLSGTGNSQFGGSSPGTSGYN
jgi:hypothetical protein